MVKRKTRLEKQIKRGTKEEHSEHPWLTYTEATRVTMDHLKKHPFMYMER